MKRVQLRTQPHFEVTEEEIIGQLYYRPTPNQLDCLNRAFYKREIERESNPDLPKAGLGLHPMLRYIGGMFPEELMEKQEVVHCKFTKEGFYDEKIGKISEIVYQKDVTKHCEDYYRGQSKLIYALFILMNFLLAPIFAQDFPIYKGNIYDTEINSEEDKKACLVKKGLIHKGIADDFEKLGDEFNKIVGGYSNFTLNEIKGMMDETRFRAYLLNKGFCRLIEKETIEVIGISDGEKRELIVTTPDTMWIYPDPTFKEFIEWKINRL